MDYFGGITGSFAWRTPCSTTIPSKEVLKPHAHKDAHSLGGVHHIEHYQN
jgi:hypothetical protein